MSYRIWINVFDMTFLSTRTESHYDTAIATAKALSEALPGSVVGVDRIERERVWNRPPCTAQARTK